MRSPPRSDDARVPRTLHGGPLPRRDRAARPLLARRPGRGGSPRARPGGGASRASIPPPSRTRSRSSPPTCSAWGGTVGVHVDRRAHRRDPRRARRARAPSTPRRTPSSLTAAAALRVLGAQHRFLTGLYGADRRRRRRRARPARRRRPLAAHARISGPWPASCARRACGACAGILGGPELLRRALRAPRLRAAAGRVGAVPRAGRGGLAQREHGALLRARRRRTGADAAVEVDPPGFVELAGSVATTRKKDDPERVTWALEAERARASPAGSAAASPRGPAGAGRRGGWTTRACSPATRCAPCCARSAIEVTRRGEAGRRRRRRRSWSSHRSREPRASCCRRSARTATTSTRRCSSRRSASEAKGRPASAGRRRPRRCAAPLEELGAFEPGVVVKNGSGLFDADRTTPRRDHGSAPGHGPRHLGGPGVRRPALHRRRRRHAARTASATGRARAPSAPRRARSTPWPRSPATCSPPPGRLARRLRDARERHPGEGRAPPAPSMDRVVEAIAREVWKGARPRDATARGV